VHLHFSILVVACAALSPHSGSIALRPDSPTTYSISPLGRPNTSIKQVWSKDEPEVSSIEAKGEYILLRKGHANHIASVLDSKTGKQLFEVTSLEQSRLQLSPGLLLTSRSHNQRAARLFQGWKLSSGDLLWSFVASATASLGGTLGDKFYFADEEAIWCADIPSGKIVDSRPVERYGGRRIVSVTPGRIYAGPVGHEVFGLSPGDLSSGWRHYCDSYPHIVTEDGFLGTGFFFGAVAVGKDGKTKWLGLHLPGPRVQFAREAPAVVDGVFVAGGQIVVGPEIHILGPYLFGMDAETGKRLWKRPMAPSNPVGFQDRVAVLAGHRKMSTGHWDIYSGRLRGLEVRIEILNARNGKLLWRSRPIPQAERNKSPLLAASSDTLILWTGTKLIAYR